MKTDVIRLTDDPEVTMTAYLLDGSTELSNAAVRPAVLIFPGGAYAVCSDREAEPVAMAYLAQGYHAFILRYSLREKANFPRPLNDAETALTCIRGYAEKWGVAPDKIAVCGFSAGGHLAAALGTMGSVRPNAMILGYPCILGSMGETLHISIPSCEQHVDEKTPPAFIFSTCNDEVVPIRNSLVFADALEKKKIPFEIHIFQDGSHGLSLARDYTSSGLKQYVNPDVAKWFDLSVCWLRKQFGCFYSANDYEGEDRVRQYDTGIALGILWKNPQCRELVLKTFPALGQAQDLRAAMSVSIRVMHNYAEDAFPEDKIQELDDALKKIPYTKTL